MRNLIVGIFIIFTLGLSFQCEEVPIDTMDPEDDPDDIEVLRDSMLLEIELPEGFAINEYAKDVVNARGMSMSPNGILYVGSRSEGKVYAVVDEDDDNYGEKVVTIDESLHSPVGVAYFKGDLYVSAISKIYKYSDIDNSYNQSPTRELVYEDYPTETSHGWKYIAFGPDNKLYVPVGAPCNICDPEEIYASITRMNPDGTDMEIIQHGIRNTVGFDWHPETGDLVFTDNGRDWLGDDLPACELNIATEDGQHFGYPYCHQGDLSDPEFGENYDCDDFVAPVQNLGPHVAPLGVEIYEGDMFPSEYKHCAFIAEHGSWNRSVPIGYRVTMVCFDENYDSKGYEMFAEGWLKNGDHWGRPVDIEMMDDGSLLVSDDYYDKIYRIRYDD